MPVFLDDRSSVPVPYCNSVGGDDLNYQSQPWLFFQDGNYISCDGLETSSFITEQFRVGQELSLENLVGSGSHLIVVPKDFLEEFVSVIIIENFLHKF